MRLPGILVLLNLLGASWATVTRNPSKIKLKWLEDEVIAGDTLPHMEITLADGSKDEIFLEADSEIECFFHGSLKSDIESEVEVDGCKNDLEVIVISSRLVPCGLVTLLLENGETYSIDPSEGRESLNGTDSIPPPTAAAFQGAGWEHDWLPKGVVAKVHVKYDQSLVNQYGGSREKAEERVKAIVRVAKAWFHRSSGLAMDVQIQVLSWEYYAGTIPHPGNALALRSLTGKGDGHPVVWFRSGGVGQHVGHIAAFCWPKHQSPGQISTVRAGAVSTAFNAQTFARALGHNLGMRKDFPDGRNHDWHWNPPGQSGGWPNRYGCNNKGIMSYSATIQNRWSTCSREDQETVFKKSHYRCMVDGIGGGGGGSSGSSGNSGSSGSIGNSGSSGFSGWSFGSSCRCNGNQVPFGPYEGAGSCSGGINWIWTIDCGNFCFVNAGACPDQIFLPALSGYGYASCKPCTQSRSAPPLKEAECPNKSSPSLIGKGMGLLTAGLLVALF